MAATSLTELQTPLTRDDVRAILLDMLEQAGFPVTAWQDEGAARSFVEAQSELGAQTSEIIALLARQVSTATADTLFLDEKAAEFGLTRFPAVAATFDVSMINAGGASYPVAAGAVILRSADGQLFENTAGGVIALLSTTVLPFRAQAAGAANNIAGQTLEITTPLAGVTALFSGTFTSIGADAESDPALRTRCLSQWGALRIEKTADGLIYLARTAAPAIHSVVTIASNPRGPGTVDVYLAGDNATASGGEVTAVQAALDLAIFGNGTVDKLVKALAAPTATQAVAANVYVRGTTAAAATAALTDAWRAFLLTVPIGGFDLSPGPVNVIQRGQIIAALALADVEIVSLDLTTPAEDIAVPPTTKILEGAIAFSVTVVL